MGKGVPASLPHFSTLANTPELALPRHFMGSYTSVQAVWAALLAARRHVLCIPSSQLTFEGKEEGSKVSELVPKLSGILYGRASLLNLKPCNWSRQWIKFIQSHKTLYVCYFKSSSPGCHRRKLIGCGKIIGTSAPASTIVCIGASHHLLKNV